MQLAIAVARVYEGDDGIVLRELLEDKVLPLAAVEGNRWLATWVFWMLGRRDMAVRALIVSSFQFHISPTQSTLTDILTVAHRHPPKQTPNPNQASKVLPLH